jgi:hypothetical protein
MKQTSVSFIVLLPLSLFFFRPLFHLSLSLSFGGHCSYETDIVEEQSFLAWAEKPSKKYAGKDLMEQIHQKVGP